MLTRAFLISLYILGVRYFYAKSPKLFRRFIVGICFLIELAIFTFINFRYFFVMDFTRFLLAICISSILFPIIFLVFLLINYSLHTFPLVYFLKLSYLSFWILLVDFFFSLLVMSLLSTYFIIIIIDFLISSVFYYYILKFGLKLERVNEVKFKKYVKSQFVNT